MLLFHLCLLGLSLSQLGLQAVSSACNLELQSERSNAAGTGDVVWNAFGDCELKRMAYMSDIETTILVKVSHVQD